jgi:hypothetical protein
VGELDIETDSSIELETLGHEVRHVFGSIVQDLSNVQVTKTVVPTVSYEGKIIYKSTLVSQLVGNPLLSKDRLTRIAQKTYYTTGQQKKRDINSPTCLVDIGSDVAIVFESGFDDGPSTRSTKLKKRKRKENDPSMEVASARREFWLGRIVLTRQKYGAQWGRCRSPIDLLDRPTPSNGQSGSICQLLLNWYKAIGKSKTQFTYDTTDVQWIDIEMVIANVNLTMKHGLQRVYVLDPIDRQACENYIQTMS